MSFSARRGPDGVGLWSSENERVVLEHRRLAIIDLSSSGAQPMSDATGRWVISFNGEIYNHGALRSELESLGCVFQTSTDTEVLINVVTLCGTVASAATGEGSFAGWSRGSAAKGQARYC